MNWIYDPAPPASRRATVDHSDTLVQSSDTHVDSRDAPVHTSDTPPLTLMHLQELLSPPHIPRSPGEGGIAAQPMRIQPPAQPPQ